MQPKHTRVSGSNCYILGNAAVVIAGDLASPRMEGVSVVAHDDAGGTAMKHSIPVVALLYLVSCVGVAIAKGKSDKLQFEMPEGWQIAHGAETKHLRIVEYVPKGDDIENWKELFTYQNGGKNHFDHSPEKMLNGIKALREKECPGVTEWTVIDKTENSVLYEWHAKPCLTWPEQHEIARIIYGKYNWFFLHYDAKVHELSPDMRAKWIKFLEAATLSWE